MSGRERIEVSVPALVSEEMFALAQEQLEKNKRYSPRRTIEPTLLQGMLVCEQCGYALYRTSTHTSKQKLNYYRCLGSDGYRRLNGPLVRIGQSDKIISISSCGARSYVCWTMRG
jgi:site-specific DNA recombinase